MKLQERLKKYREISHLKGWDIILIFIILSVIILTMHYADITVTSQFSLIFLDSLFDGEFASFYNNSLTSGIAPEGAVYDIGLYFVFAIWGIPVWILKNIANINVLGVGSLLWFKLLVVLFGIGTTILVGKIAKCLYFKEEVCIYSSLVYILSLLFSFPVFVIAQYDVIPLFFVLNGVHKWLDKGVNKGLISFAFAFTMKPFAILVFAIMLLLEEKNILSIVLRGGITLVPWLICKVIYIFNPVNNASNNNFFLEMFPKLLKVKFDVGSGECSVFFLLIFIIYLIAYIYVPQNSKLTKGEQFVLLSFTLWSSFCVFAEVYPYWIIYLAPFLSIIIFFNLSYVNLMLMLEMIVNVGIIFLMIIQYPWVYGGQKTFSYLVLKPMYEIIGAKNISTVGGGLNVLNLMKFQPIVSAAVLASVVMLLFLAYKGLSAGIKVDNNTLISPWHIRIRAVMLYGWMMLCLILLLM